MTKSKIKVLCRKVIEVKFTVSGFHMAYVAVPPVITMRLESREGVQERPFNLSCQGSGLPKPTYEFHKV